MIASPPQNKPVIIDFTSGFNPNLSFSRASTATKTNKSGNLESVLSGIPRIDFNAITGESRGVLIEPQATNLLLQSESFASPWAFIGSSVDSSLVVPPSNTGTAKKLKESASTGSHFAYQPVSFTLGTAYTFSFYAKAGERKKVLAVGQATAFAANQAVFDLEAGTASAAVGCVARIEQVSNGFFRCSWTATATATTAANLHIYLLDATGSTSYAGDGASGAYVWGAQCEAASRASSYIATTTAQVTRAADSLSIQGAVFNRFFTQSGGAIYVEFEHGRAAWPSSTPAVMCISDGTGTGEASGIVLSASAAGTSLDVSSSGVSQASLLVSNGSAAGVHRAAFSYKADSFSLSVDNATPSVDTAGTIPTLSRLDIGSVIGARHFSGWIKRIAIFPRAASSATIQSITQ